MVDDVVELQRTFIANVFEYSRDDAFPFKSLQVPLEAFTHYIMGSVENAHGEAFRNGDPAFIGQHLLWVALNQVIGKEAEKVSIGKMAGGPEFLVFQRND